MIDKTLSGRATTKREAAYLSSLILNLNDLQKDLKGIWLQESLPDEWQSLDPVEPETTRVTLRLDTDIVKLFRRLGPGYQKRINQILRVYVDAAAAGKINTSPNLEDLGPSFLSPLIQAAQLKSLHDVEQMMRLEVEKAQTK